MPSKPTKPRNPITKPLPGPLELSKLLRRRRAIVTLLVVLAIAGLSMLDHAGGLLPVGDDWHRYHGKRFEVVRVIDGDTLDLRVPDGDSVNTRVRLWGVDAPELAKRPGETSERGGEAATQAVRRLADGQTVTILLQAHRHRGRYGRLLAYVVLPDGAVLNEQLIEQGMVKADDRWSHENAARYLELERQARRTKRGLWAK